MLLVARWKCRTQKLAKKSPSGHHRTTLSGHIFAIILVESVKHLILIRTKFLFWTARAAAAWTELFRVLAALQRCAPSALVAAGRRTARTGLADPPEDWQAASPRDAAAVTPRESKSRSSRDFGS